MKQCQKKIGQLQGNLSEAQSQIVIASSKLDKERKQIATLKGLTMGLDIALADIKSTQSALDGLRTVICYLKEEINFAAEKVQKSENANDALMQKIWFDAAVISWQNILLFAKGFATNNAPIPTHMSIG